MTKESGNNSRKNEIKPRRIISSICQRALPDPARRPAHDFLSESELIRSASGLA
jgi:hypothetical protein